MSLKGGSLKVKEIKAFLEASYMENPPKELMGYELDELLSFLYGKVYVNHKMKKVVVSHRGTVENFDWGNNIVYALNSEAYKLTPRYKAGLKMQNDAHKKYKGYQFEVCGHSQGGLLTHLLSGKSKNAYLVNPAYKKEQLKDNEYVIRSSGDVVSKMSVPRKYFNALLYPNFSKNHYITIPAKTSNPIKEHEINILDRLDQERKIGRGAGLSKMTGGARASNPWVEHVKKYAKENNITYACAISEAKKTYVKVDKDAKKKEMMEIMKKKWRSDINKNFTTVLRANPESLPSLRLKFKTRNKGYQEYMEQVAPKMYMKLTEKKGKAQMVQKPKKEEPHPYDVIASNWDDDYLNLIIDQQLPTLGENIRKIAEKKTLNDDLLLTLFPKEIVEEILSRRDVEYLANGLNTIVENYNGRSLYPNWVLRKGSFPEQLRQSILNDLEGVKISLNRV